MRLTTRHLDYWRERKTNPSWIAQINQPEARIKSWVPPAPSAPRVSIHEIVNLNAGPIERNASMHTLPLLRQARSNGTLHYCMLGCSKSTQQHVRRARWCEKWLKRITPEAS